MKAQRETTVLFAGVAGSTQPSVDQCIETLRQATELSGGRVLKASGDEVLALFPSPDAAAGAASRMHVYVESLAQLREKPAVRIGFHSGPVAQRENDVFGDTVNLALRLVEEAAQGQIVTSQDTASRLNPVIRNSMRALRSIRVNGKGKELALSELLWRQDSGAPEVPRGAPRRSPATLHLNYRGTRIVRRRGNDTLVIGRDEGCDVLIGGPAASRQQCTIERRGDKFVLRDHSTNGTYVTVEGEGELKLLAQELTLRARGWLAFGQPRLLTSEVIEYFCD
ncbi:MAG TPA: adenylate/guanylate cyclase domain-containing protein [Burkholderiales bacterium]|nr:adenylate/guanylate cyclase domain-containing protein [Burkholderiales bacterium]